MFKRFKKSAASAETGSALASTLVIMAGLALLVTSTTVSQSTHSQVAVNTAVKVHAFLNSQSGLEIALDRLNHGMSPHIDELGFAGGTITVTSNPAASTVTSTGQYGNATETQTIGFENTDGHTTINPDVTDIGFAKNCVKIDLTNAYLDLPTRNLRGVEVTRYCNLEAHAESMSVSWNLTPCQEEIAAYEATFNPDDEELVTFCHVPKDGASQPPYTMTISRHLWDTVHSTNHSEDYLGACSTPPSGICNTNNGPIRLREVHFSQVGGGAPADDVIYEESTGVTSGTTLGFHEILTETNYQFGTNDPVQDALSFDADMPFEFFATVAINFQDGSQAIGVGLAYDKDTTSPPPDGTPPPGGNPPPPPGDNPPPPSDTEPPSVPQGLQVDFVLDNQVGLSWQASTDNDKVNDYEIYRDGQFIAQTQNLNNVDAGVSPSTTYQYQVLATDPSGNKSALSAPVSATTNPPPGGP